MPVILTLQEKEHLIDNVWAFRFIPSEPQTWVAGQYMSVDLPHDNPDGKGTKRWFTISSAPFESFMQITTRITDSSFKQALSTLPIGGHLDLLDQPHGMFVWQETDKPLVFIAGGIGITSFRSILRQRAHDNLPLTAHLIYANRTNDIAFKEELDGYVLKDPKFKLDYVVGEPLTAARVTQLVPDINSALVYISGSIPLVAMGNDLKLAGLPIDQFKQDFYPAYTDKNY